MKIYLATDHAGFELKEYIKEILVTDGYDVEDLGAYELNPKDDYPDFIQEAAQAVAQNPGTYGIIFGGSGQGEAMVANRYADVRATVYYGGDKKILQLSKEHNDANILSLGAKFLEPEEALEVVRLWLATEFSADERHVRRLSKF